MRDPDSAMNLPDDDYALTPKGGHRHHVKKSSVRKKHNWSYVLSFMWNIGGKLLLVSLITVLWDILFHFVFEKSEDLAALFPIFDFSFYILIPLTSLLTVIATLQSIIYYHFTNHVSKFCAASYALKSSLPSQKEEINAVIRQVASFVNDPCPGIGSEIQNLQRALRNNSESSTLLLKADYITHFIEEALEIESCLVILECQPLYRISEVLCYLFAIGLPWILWDPFKWVSFVIEILAMLPLFSLHHFTGLYRKQARLQNDSAFSWSQLVDRLTEALTSP